MCIIHGPRPPEEISGTRIYGRFRDERIQQLAYSMQVSAVDDLAMVLPLPVVPGSGEDAVCFIDLSGYKRFFIAMDSGFLAPESRAPAGRGRSRGRSAPMLKVYEVGDFVASYVPTLDDFDRLDARFRLPAEVWDALPVYADHGFAVFKLRELGVEPKTVHPMAFEFPSRDPQRLFFPTVHVHDGAVHAKAEFDHTLYMQPRLPGEGAPEGWERSRLDASYFLDVSRVQGLVHGGARCFRHSMVGTYENEDVWVSSS